MAMSVNKNNNRLLNTYDSRSLYNANSDFNEENKPDGEAKTEENKKDENIIKDEAKSDENKKGQSEENK